MPENQPPTDEKLAECFPDKDEACQVIMIHTPQDASRIPDAAVGKTIQRKGLRFRFLQALKNGVWKTVTSPNGRCRRICVLASLLRRQVAFQVRSDIYE